MRFSLLLIFIVLQASRVLSQSYGPCSKGRCALCSINSYGKEYCKKCLYGTLVGSNYLDNTYCVNGPTITNCKVSSMGRRGEFVCEECSWRHKAIVEIVDGRKIVKKCEPMTHSELMKTGISYYCAQGEQIGEEPLKCESCTLIFYSKSGFCTGLTVTEKDEGCFRYNSNKECIECQQNYILEAETMLCIAVSNSYCSIWKDEHCVLCNNSQGYVAVTVDSKDRSQVCKKDYLSQYELKYFS